MSEPETRKIIHIDMDAFYASVEQRDNPELRGKPVAVGGSKMRGVVAAASYEARKFGVRSAMPSLTAKNKCPELIFVKPRFDIYKSVSCQIRAIFEEYTTLVEPLSLDEAYLDVTHNLKGIEYATRVAKEIRARIKDQTGLNASAGISYNKFLAKLGSDHNKPNGQFTIVPGDGEAFVATLPVARFHGVGPVTVAKMNKLGLFTGADLHAQTMEFLKESFGKSGPYYYAIARGQDDRRVNPDRERKSVGSETTFFEDLSGLTEVQDKVKEQFDEVWSYCAKAGMAGRTVTVKIKYADFQIVTRSRSDSVPFTDRATVERYCIELVRSVFPLEKSIRLLGVTISNFGAAEADDSPQLAFELPHD